MKKIIKYEFIGTYHIYLFIFSIMTLLNLLLFTRVGVWKNYQINILISMICFAGFISILMFCVKSYSDELNTDYGYLTFTLPINNIRILNCKFILTLFWIILWFVFSYLFKTIGFNVFTNTYEGMNPDIFSMFKAMNLDVKIGFLSIILIIILTIVLLIFLAITITKVTFKNLKLNKFLAFCVFLVAIFLVVFIDIIIIKNFNFFLYIGDKTLNSHLNGNWTIGIGYSFELTKILYNGYVAKINIPSLIYSILVLIGLYSTVGHLLQRRLSL